MTWLFSCSVRGSVHLHSGRERRRLPLYCVWSSRRLGTPEVKIPSVPVPAFTGTSTGVEHLAGQQLPDRPDVKTSDYMIASIKFWVSMRIRVTRYFALFCKLFHQSKALCHPTALLKNTPVEKKRASSRKILVLELDLCFFIHWVKKSSIISKHEHNFQK